MKRLALLVVLLIAFASVVGGEQRVVIKNSGVTTPSGLCNPSQIGNGGDNGNCQLLHEANFTHDGSAKYTAPVGSNNYSYQELGSMSYDETSGTFWVGYSNFVGQITMPSTFVNTASTGSMNGITWTQELSSIAPAGDIRGDLNVATDGEWLIGGVLRSGSYLYGSAFVYYDNGAPPNTDETHWRRPVADALATTTNFIGLEQVWYGDETLIPSNTPDGVGSYVASYTSKIPTAYQALLGGTSLWGGQCMSIVDRTSQGPAAFAVNETLIGSGSAQPHAAIPLLFYSAGHVLGPYNDNSGTASATWNGTSCVNGVDIIPGTRTVVFMGRSGTGPSCYGGAVACGDPVEPGSGPHAYPYKYRVYLYDLADLVAVKNGTKQPYEPQPYEKFFVDVPTYDPVTGKAHHLGHAFVPTDTGNPALGGKLYWIQGAAFGEDPVFHRMTVTIP